MTKAFKLNKVMREFKRKMLMMLLIKKMMNMMMIMMMMENRHDHTLNRG